MIFFFALMVIVPVVMCWCYIVFQHKVHNTYSDTDKLEKNYSLLMYWIVGIWFVLSTVYGLSPSLFVHQHYEYDIGSVVTLSISAILGCFIIWCFFKETPKSFIQIFMSPSAELRKEITDEITAKLEDQFCKVAVQNKIEEIALVEYKRHQKELNEQEAEKPEIPKDPLDLLEDIKL